tara:strand:+ start:109 stop:618 length:510 start_codon:yes stop_codon:yes gene_type:complete
MKVRRHLLAITVLPGTVTIVVPLLLLARGGGAVALERIPDPLLPVATFGGAVLIVGGLLLMYRTISLFARAGRGTLAPWDPPEKLVVRGVYRRLRNPMISGVAAVLAGETLVFASPWLALWTVLFVTLNAIYIPLVEERGLERRFGASYLDYKRNVPRWLPRATPWHRR